MKPCPKILAGWLILGTWMAHGAQRAEVRMHALSLQFQTARTEGGIPQSTLELGTVEVPDGLNGEVAPGFDPTLPSHFAFFRLQDASFPEPLRGLLAVDIPEVADENGNGFSDFFEARQGYSGATSFGLYSTSVDDGTVTATWSRAAGTTQGTCRLKLTSLAFGELPTYVANFELLEYTGSLDYTPGVTNVQGVLNLVRTQNPADTLAGTVEFLKSSQNRFNDLLLLDGAWTNGVGKSLTFTNAFISRDLILRTNYFGLVDFEDGDLSTSDPDFLTWQLSIDDLHDADKNGIPDFSDDPGEVNVVRPSLRVESLTSAVLRLELKGRSGRIYQVEESPALRDPKWNVILLVPLTNQMQSVDVAVPTSGTGFWRAREFGQ